PNLVSDFEKRLWLASGLFPQQNSYVYFASESGRFLGVQRDAPGGAEVRMRAQTNEPRRVFRANGPGQRGGLIREEKYDPHDRPWYKEALARRALTWTPVYRDFSTGAPTVTLAKPVFKPNGTLVGVAATDMSLARLTQFVRTLNLSSNSVAFVVEPNGSLVVSSAEEGSSAQPNTDARPLASNSGSRLIREAYAAIANKTAAAPISPTPTTRSSVRHSEFDSTDFGAAHVSVISHRDNAGLDWRFVVAVPRADHMGPVYRAMAENLAISAAAVLLALALGTWMFHRVAEDVSRVSRAANKLVSGEGPITAIPERDDEIGVLASSMAAIQDALLYDKLTGALNRAAFVKQFGVAIEALRPQERLAIIYIDLDRFKKVNDRYGHTVGDAVLAKSAERVRRRLREQDLFARYGGDEFVIMVRGNAAVDAVDALVQRLIERLSLGMTVGELNVAIGASIGTAIYPSDGETLDELIAIADSRMYGEKRKTAHIRKLRKSASFISSP
ncbi:MAG: diguanylate cyclase domain-containing protein, partial [Casimicrobium sp.]